MIRIQKGVNVAWVYDCTKPVSGYAAFLAELRSGNYGTVMHLGKRVPDPNCVSLDPEADRWVHDNPSSFRGGIMIPPKGLPDVRVSESFGEGRLPPRMR